MFRRSSKRAFSSTRQTLCLPFSAASISAGASAESWLVRYTVVLSVTTFGILRGRAHERLDARRERVVRVLDDDVARGDLGEQVPSFGVASRRWVNGTHGSSFRSGRSSVVELGDVGEVEQAVDRVDELGPRRAGAPASRREHRASRSSCETSSRTTAPKRRFCSSLSTATSRSSASSEISVSPSRVTPERGLLDDLHLREEPVEEVRDHVLERDQQAALADRDEARQALGHLHAREALLARLGVADDHAEREREARDVRERLARADRERRQHRVDPLREGRLELVAARPRSRRRRCRRGCPRRRARGGARAARARTARAVSVEHALAHLRRASAAACGRRASGRRARPRPGRAGRRRGP